MTQFGLRADMGVYITPVGAGNWGFRQPSFIFQSFRLFISAKSLSMLAESTTSTLSVRSQSSHTTSVLQPEIFINLSSPGTIDEMARPNLAPASPAYKDLRSHQVEAKRINKTAQKYSNFKYVKPGQVGQPHYVNIINGFYSSWPGEIHDRKVVTLSKKQLFEEALRTDPRCHHKRRCPDKARKDSKRFAEHQERRARAEALSWSKLHAFSELTEKRDHRFYDELGQWDAEYELQHDWFMNGGLFGGFKPEDQFGEVEESLDERLDLGPLVDAAMENWKLKATHRKAWCNWIEIPVDWLFSPDYELVEGDEQFMSDFELI